MGKRFIRLCSAKNFLTGLPAYIARPKKTSTRTNLRRISLHKILPLIERYKWAVLLILLFGGATGVIAGEGPTATSLPLNDVLTLVTQTNPEIMEAVSQYRSVLAERSIATSGYWPTVGTELSGGPEVTGGAGSPGNESDRRIASQATLYARQNLFNGGKTSAFVKETDARILAAAYEVLNVTNRVYLETAEAYIYVLQARELLKLSEENVLTQEQILEQVREKSTAGFTRISDMKNAESRLALARGNYISEQQDLNQAVVQFQRQFGRLAKPEAFVKPEPKFQFPDTVEKTVAVAFRKHPALDVAKYNILSRKYSYEKVKADYWPSIDLEVRALHRSNFDFGDTDQVSAMLKLNYTFFDGGRRKGEKQKNYQFLHKENRRAYVERRNVNETVRLAWNIMQAEKQKKKYLTDHVELSAETLAAFKEEYLIGRRTLFDLLNMEIEFNSAQNAGAESKFSYLIAYYRISQATGMMIHEFDTGLRTLMNFPPEMRFDLKDFKDLDRNKDLDSTEDVQDQCDSSIKGSKTPASGCIEDDAVHLGYEEPADLSPYILPKAGTPAELTLKIDKVKREQSFNLDIIHFNTGSADLTNGSFDKLKYVADQLKSADGFIIEVVGHTDNTASARFNQQLSYARAQSVCTELIRLGLKKENLKLSGRGEHEPVATNATQEGRRKNRRIEFKLFKKQP